MIVTDYAQCLPGKCGACVEPADVSHYSNQKVLTESGLTTKSDNWIDPCIIPRCSTIFSTGSIDTRSASDAEILVYISQSESAKDVERVAIVLYDRITRHLSPDSLLYLVVGV
jgi:hypothetical protein